MRGSLLFWETRSAPNRKGSLAPTIYITESFNYAPFCCLPLQPPTSPVPSRLLFWIHGRHLRRICPIDVEYAIFFRLERCVQPVSGSGRTLVPRAGGWAKQRRLREGWLQAISQLRSAWISPSGDRGRCGLLAANRQ